MTRDGGPAFPRPYSGPDNGECEPAWAQDGMTLRDWFAGQALAGLLAKGGGDDPVLCTEVHSAYRYADAMLREREVAR